jgi:hypothetical protein
MGTLGLYLRGATTPKPPPPPHPKNIKTNFTPNFPSKIHLSPPTLDKKKKRWIYFSDP